MTEYMTDSPHILLIDENPTQLRRLIAALRGKHYRVTIADDGLQGYARAAYLVPDLILLETYLPHQDGFTLARMLKATPATRRIPILFLSAATELKARLNGFRNGAVDYITKPFHVEEVLERVRAHLAIARGRNKSARLPAGPVGKPPGAGAAPPPAQSADQTLLKVASDAILNHIHHPLRTQDLAAMLGTSERRLNAIFVSDTGMTVFEFTRDARMRKASLLLSRTTLTIAEIATEIGYSTPANFTTEFRKFWGRTPSIFRETPD